MIVERSSAMVSLGFMAARNQVSKYYDIKDF